VKQENLEYIRYRMAAAHETLTEARTLLDSGLLRGTVNRLYYACFYVVSALLLTENLHSAKHSGVRSLFVRHWIKSKRLPTTLGDFYQRIFSHRQTGDYRDLADFGREDVEAWFREAQGFLDTVSQRIKEQLQDEQ